MLANADMEFPTVEDPEGDDQPITLNNFTTLQKHPDREFRERVYEAFYDEWGTVRNAVGAAYKNSVKTDVKMARARNYDTAREAALDGPNVPAEVYDTLVDTVDENLDTLHRHADLKREALGVEKLRMWDLYVPLVQEESPTIEYEQACEYVVDAVAPLGDAYQSRLETGLDSRWVDVYETKHKQSGAYSGGTYDSQPFILLNYQDDVESMYTLAHELGHSLHSEYTSETQPYVYSGYEIFVAEVASTVNETLLTHHLLETVEDERLRRHVLNEYLERFRSTLYRQTMFAEFEHRTHEMAEAGEPLTPDRLDDLYADLKGEYYAPPNSTTASPASGCASRTSTGRSTSISTPPASRRRWRWSTTSSNTGRGPPSATLISCVAAPGSTRWNSCVTPASTWPAPNRSSRRSTPTPSTSTSSRG